MTKAMWLVAAVLVTTGATQVWAQSNPAQPSATLTSPLQQAAQQPRPAPDPAKAEPQSADVSQNCKSRPDTSGCPGTGPRLNPPTGAKTPGNTEMLTSPTGMLTDSGGVVPPKESDAKPTQPSTPHAAVLPPLSQPKPPSP